MFDNILKAWRYFLLYKNNKHLYERAVLEAKEVITAYKQAKAESSDSGSNLSPKEMKAIYKEGMDVLESLEPILDILIVGTQHLKGDLSFKPIPAISNISNLQEFKNLLLNNSTMIKKDKLIKLIDSSENDIELITPIYKKMGQFNYLFFSKKLFALKNK